MTARALTKRSECNGDRAAAPGDGVAALPVYDVKQLEFMLQAEPSDTARAIVDAETE